MKAETVHVTNHAMTRWAERVSYTDYRLIESDVIEAVKKSTIIEGALPYGTPRIDGTLYTSYDDIVFVLESVSHRVFRVVTVLTVLTVDPRTKSEVEAEYTTKDQFQLEMAIDYYLEKNKLHKELETLRDKQHALIYNHETKQYEENKYKKRLEVVMRIHEIDIWIQSYRNSIRNKKAGIHNYREFIKSKIKALKPHNITKSQMEERTLLEHRCAVLTEILK